MIHDNVLIFAYAVDRITPEVMAWDVLQQYCCCQLRAMAWYIYCMASGMVYPLKLGCKRKFVDNPDMKRSISLTDNTMLV